MVLQKRQYEQLSTKYVAIYGAKTWTLNKALRKKTSFQPLKLITGDEQQIIKARKSQELTFQKKGALEGGAENETQKDAGIRIKRMESEEWQRESHDQKAKDRRKWINGVRECLHDYGLREEAILLGQIQLEDEIKRNIQKKKTSELRNSLHNNDN